MPDISRSTASIPWPGADHLETTPYWPPRHSQLCRWFQKSLSQPRPAGSSGCEDLECHSTAYGVDAVQPGHDSLPPAMTIQVSEQLQASKSPWLRLLDDGQPGVYSAATGLACRRWLSVELTPDSPSMALLTKMAPPMAPSPLVNWKYSGI